MPVDQLEITEALGYLLARYQGLEEEIDRAGTVESAARAEFDAAFQARDIHWNAMSAGTKTRAASKVTDELYQARTHLAQELAEEVVRIFVLQKTKPNPELVA